MLTLGIESTCDETGCAIVRNGKDILSNVVTSQIDLHDQFGGVVPELACRRHVDVMLPVIDEAVKQANINLEDIDLIAVAHGPGLIGALLIGLHAAKGLSLALQKPLIGVNHVEAHLYAALMSHAEPIRFPALGVVLSGGHTALVQMHAPDQFTLLSQTVDDAIGEAFDKVAKILDLPYPGGPEIEKLAELGKPHLPLKSGTVKGRPLDFSFSGLKTAVLYAVKGQNNSAIRQSLSQTAKSDIAASFQQAAFHDVIKKTLQASAQIECRDIIFGGGVTNSQTLRNMFREASPDLTLHWPSFGMSLDNAAMIAGLGHHRYRNEQFDACLHLEAATRLPFSQ